MCGVWVFFYFFRWSQVTNKVVSVQLIHDRWITKNTNRFWCNFVERLVMTREDVILFCWRSGFFVDSSSLCHRSLFIAIHRHNLYSVFCIHQVAAPSSASVCHLWSLLVSKAMLLFYLTDQPWRVSTRCPWLANCSILLAVYFQPARRVESHPNPEINGQPDTHRFRIAFPSAIPSRQNHREWSSKQRTMTNVDC